MLHTPHPTRNTSHPIPHTPYPAPYTQYLTPYPHTPYPVPSRALGTVTFDMDSAASLSGGVVPDGIMVPYDGAQLTPYSPARSQSGGFASGGLVMPNLDKPFSSKLLNQVG